jgi:hypothetical protein
MPFQHLFHKKQAWQTDHFSLKFSFPLFSFVYLEHFDLTNKLTDFMELNPSPETTNCAATQELLSNL